MPSFTKTVVASAMLALVRGQAVIISAKGDTGTSVGLQVDPKNSADANIISQDEIVANVVNECGRTLLAGNIDIGEQTELGLTAGAVTKVKKGSDVTVTISQRDANGVGPFTCDLDQTSNANGNSGQVPLTVTQGNANSGTGDVTIKVAMPANMACIGASTGDVCTVRCKNAANFGGCFAVQQTDITPTKNTPQNIATAQTLEGILQQVQQDQKDLIPAIGGIQAATKVDDQGVKVADAVLAANPGLSSATPATGGAKNSTAGTGAGTGKATSGKKNGNNANANANANARGNRNNNKRSPVAGLRWAKRYVVPGADFSEENN